MLGFLPHFLSCYNVKNREQNINCDNLFEPFSLSLWRKNICNLTHIIDSMFGPVSLNLPLDTLYKIHEEDLYDGNMFGPIPPSLWLKNIHTLTLNTDNIFVLFSTSLFKLKNSCTEQQYLKYIQAFPSLVMTKKYMYLNITHAICSVLNFFLSLSRYNVQNS